MVTFAIHTSHLRHPQLITLFSDHLAWDRARARRHRLVPICLAAALMALALATSLPHPGPLLRWVATPACLSPLAWAGLRERRLARRASAGLANARSKKVIKTP